MKKHHFRSCLVLLLLAAAPAAWATTYYVAATGNDANPGTQASPWATIGHGIVAAVAGDTLQVAAGTYPEHITWSSKDLTIQGAGAGQSIIDGGNTGTVVTTHSLSTASSFTGFTIQHGNFTNPTGGMDLERSNLSISNCIFTANTTGAGVLYINTSNPTVTNCTITANTGGGSFLFAASPHFVNCTFSNNTDIEGAGVTANTVMGQPDTAPIFDNCTFSGNKTTQDGGCAVYIKAGTVTMNHCSFTNNTSPAADADGGAIYNDGTLTLTDCTLTGNTLTGANTLGGAVSSTGTLNMTRCVVSNNTAFVASILYAGGHTSAVDCLFANNPSNSYSIYLAGIDAFENCTFTGNTNTSGMAREFESTPASFENCILWGDGGGGEIVNSASSPPLVDYSDVQGGYTGTGNINADPKFVNAAGGNYRLQSTSPCINTGTTVTGGFPDTDLDGYSRTQGSSTDMGAYETWLASDGIWYVDKALGSDTTGNGSPQTPYATVTKAINSAAAGNSIYVKQGNYSTDKPRITKVLHLYNWTNTGISRVGAQ